MPVKARLTVLAYFLGLTFPAFAQDVEFVKQQVSMLCSEKFYGRGYVENGDSIAAQYLSDQFSKFHLASLGNDYFQHYDFKVNTFPGGMLVKIDGKELIPGKDYVVYPASAGVRGTFNVEVMDSTLFTPGFKALHLLKENYSHTYLVVDTLGWSKYAEGKNTWDLLNVNSVNAAGIAFLSHKDIYYSVASYQLKYSSLIIKHSAIQGKPRKITLDIQSRLKDHSAVNVIGFIPGQVDSFLVITAHYDHLGMMGKSTCFRGANDNASGCSMLLDFVRYYSSVSPRHKYSFAFMLFSGEEAGLLGSAYYTKNPLFPLQKIKMLINLDMVGTGTEGVNVYFGSIYPKEFNKLDSINKNKGLNIHLIAKGISKRSDQYFFFLNSVPVLYFATLKSDASYHSPGDTPDALPFTVYESLYKLIGSYFMTL